MKKTKRPVPPAIGQPQQTSSPLQLMMQCLGEAAAVRTQVAADRVQLRSESGVLRRGTVEEGLAIADRLEAQAEQALALAMQPRLADVVARTVSQVVGGIQGGELAAVKVDDRWTVQPVAGRKS